jgi:hypothetical protein
LPGAPASEWPVHNEDAKRRVNPHISQGVSPNSSFGPFGAYLASVLERNVFDIPSERRSRSAPKQDSASVDE